MRKCRYNSIRPNSLGNMPRINPSAYIDPTAQIIGNVEIGHGVFVGPNAVIRADEIGESGAVEPILIGSECNIQDGVVIHSLGGELVTVGSRVSMAHGCVIHGPCTVGEGSFIGFRAIIFKATLDAVTFVGHGAIVQGVELPAGAMVPPGMVVLSQETADGLPKAGPKEDEFMEEVVETNLELARGYLALLNEDKNEEE